MPRLSEPTINKGNAISCLVRVYWNNRKFRQELQELSQPYTRPLTELAMVLIKILASCRQHLSSEDYQRNVDNLYEAVFVRFKESELPPDLSHRHRQIKQIHEELQTYLDDLEKLAYKWKLRAPWAGRMLHLYNMTDHLKTLGNTDVPLQALEYLHHWSLAYPDLKITVSPWALVHYGRKDVELSIARRLKDYESKLKAMGLKEYPSHLENHARWWFEHYVHGKKYDDIAQEEVYTPGGSLIAHAKNAGQAVRRFTRLIDIDARDLK